MVPVDFAGAFGWGRSGWLVENRGNATVDDTDVVEERARTQRQQQEQRATTLATTTTRKSKFRQLDVQH